MTYGLFNKLWLDALQEPDIERYIADYGYPDFFDDISDDADRIATVLIEIHRAAHMSVAEILTDKGMSIDDFVERFCLPRDLCLAWLSSTEKCPDHLRLMFLRSLRLLKVKIDFDSKKYNKQYREKNREAVSNGLKKWAEDHKENLRENSLRWYHNNKNNQDLKQRVKETNKKYYERNKDKILESRKKTRAQETEERKQAIKQYQHEYYLRKKKERSQDQKINN